ncbi:MAG: sodium:calcium antiporter [Brevinema sp.]
MLENFYLILAIIISCIFVVFFVGDKLVEYADQLSILTKISGAFIGLLLIAAITSVPELISTVIAVKQGLFGLASGGVLGSNLINLAILSTICLIHFKQKINITTQSLFSLLVSITLLCLPMLALSLAWIVDIQVNKFVLFGLGLVIYLWAMSYNFGLHQDAQAEAEFEAESTSPHQTNKTLPQVIFGFTFFAFLIIAISWVLVFLCDALATVPAPIINKPLGQHFIGTLILAFVTSVPEVATTFQIIKKGHTSIAVENIFGSNMFNLVTLLFASTLVTGNFWRETPLNNLFIIISIMFATILLAVLTLVKKNSVAIGVVIFSSIILLWIATLRLVF